MLFKNSVISLSGVGGIIGIVGGVSYVYSNKKLPRNLQKDNLSLDVEDESHKDHEDNNEQLNETNEEDNKVKDKDNSDKREIETSSESSPLPIVEQPQESASSIAETAPNPSKQIEEVVKK